MTPFTYQNSCSEFRTMDRLRSMGTGHGQLTHSCSLLPSAAGSGSCPASGSPPPSHNVVVVLGLLGPWTRHQVERQPELRNLCGQEPAKNHSVLGYTCEVYHCPSLFHPAAVCRRRRPWSSVRGTFLQILHVPFMATRLRLVHVDRACRCLHHRSWMISEASAADACSWPWP